MSERKHGERGAPERDRQTTLATCAVAQPEENALACADAELSAAQHAALMTLADIPRGAAFVPARAQRPDFHVLVALGLAISRGQGLGGEGFAPTPTGRRAAHGGRISSRHPKRARGFAVMSPERRREIASLGGKAVPAHERSFSKDRVLAATAGRAGGEAGFGRGPLREPREG
jgi:uncharacterized protein